MRSLQTCHPAAPPATCLPLARDEAILDRLLHHWEVIAIDGPSYRLKNRLAAVGAAVKTATA